MEVRIDTGWVDPRKHGGPYAALLAVDKTGKLVREFLDLPRFFGKRTVRLDGVIDLPTGAIIEMRVDGSWKNDYRLYYEVTEQGLIPLVVHHSAGGPGQPATSRQISDSHGAARLLMERASANIPSNSAAAVSMADFGL